VKTTIVLVNGKAGSGKDTACDLIQKQLISQDKRCFVVGNADVVRQVCFNTYGWDRVKDDRGRQLLIDVTDAGYNYDPYFWEKKSRETINTIKYLRPEEDIIILVNDWRYKSTYDFWCAERCRVLTIRVNRGIEDCTPYKETIKKDKSEVGLDTFVFDHFVLNDGSLEDLDTSLERVVRDIICY
jgi:hypothetical protein